MLTRRNFLKGIGAALAGLVMPRGKQEAEVDQKPKEYHLTFTEAETVFEYRWPITTDYIAKWKGGAWTEVLREPEPPAECETCPMREQCNPGPDWPPCWTHNHWDDVEGWF